MNAKTIRATNFEELKHELALQMSADFQPTLGIVFSSVTHDIQSIGQLFEEHAIDLVASSSSGEICNDEFSLLSIVVLLMDIKPSDYRIHFVENQDETTYQVAHAAGVFAKEQFENPAIILFSSGLTVNGDDLVLGLNDGVGKTFPLFGALAGVDLYEQEPFVFTKNQQASKGLASLIINTDRIEVKGMATSGWEPIGAVNTITKSKGNIIYTINEKPAYDVYLNFFSGNEPKTDLSDEELMQSLRGQYPMQILKENGDTILRAPHIGDKKERSLLISGSVKEGDQFRFSISPGFEVVDQTIDEFQKFSKEVPDADALILFSCKGRHYALGPLIEDEVSGVFNHWSTAMVGFLSYGEIGNTRLGKCEFHSETCSLVVLKEKE